MIVISDTKDDQNSNYLKDFIIFEEYEKIPNRVISVLQNYDTIYKNLFENFDIQEIDNKIKKLSLSTVNHLLS